MIRIGICDDEIAIHNLVKKYILEELREEQMEFVSFLQGEELLDYCEELDILLLDIVMPKMDGIEVGHLLRKNKRVGKIIMLTSKSERFQEAFEIEAYRFVTKPVIKEQLLKAVRAAVKTLVGRESVEVYAEGEKYTFAQKEIAYIAKLQSRTEVIAYGMAYQSERTLEEWEKQLDERLFFRTHKGYIVNFSRIDKLADKIYMDNGEIVPIARRRKSELVRRYMQYDIEFR